MGMLRTFPSIIWYRNGWHRPNPKEEGRTSFLPGGTRTGHRGRIGALGAVKRPSFGRIVPSLGPGSVQALAANRPIPQHSAQTLGSGRPTACRCSQLGLCQAAKKTSDLIPLCHPLALTRVAVEFELLPSDSAVQCTATVETVGPTGVEMEALTAVQVALLTVYDMCKAADKRMVMTGVRVLEKRGGKSGSFLA